MNKLTKSFIFVLSFWILSSINAFSVPLSGTYRIGGANKNFNNFTQAVDSLRANGVSGAVLFLVKDSVYQEQIFIPTITGASATNTITFEGTNPDSSQTVLTHDLSFTSFSGHILHLSGARFLRFKRISFEKRAASVSGNTIGMSRNTYNIQFVSCRFVYTSSNTGVSHIRDNYLNETSSNGTLDSNFTFQKCYFFRGGGLDFGSTIANSSFRRSKITIEDCLFEGMGSPNINIVYGINLKIKNNSFVNCFGLASLNTVAFFEVSNNKLINSNVSSNQILALTSANTGIIEKNYFSTNGINILTLFSINGASTTQKVTIRNNSFIYPNANSTGQRVISITSGNYLDFYHNNTYIYRNTNNITLLYITTPGVGLNIKNNNFTHIGGSEVELVNLFNISTNKPDMNYNNYYSTNKGSKFLYNSAVYSTLSAFRTAQGFETNGLVSNPFYISPTDLHTKGLGIYKRGLPNTIAPTDMDGQTRSTTAPCIGADEFELDSNDASLQEAEFSLACASQTIPISVSNVGLDSLRRVRISYSVNGGAVVSNTYLFNKPLPNGKDTLLFLPPFNFSKLVGVNNVKVWSSLPNNRPDWDKRDDTVLYQITTRMSGNYRIGSSSLADYPTFTDAVTALTANGVCTPVTFFVEDGKYVESITINTFPGNIAANPVRFTSLSGDSSKVILSYPSSNFTALLNILVAAPYINLVKLTFERTGNAVYHQSITLNRKNISIINCRIIAGKYNPVTGLPNNSWGIAIGQNLDSINIQNNIIKNGYYAIRGLSFNGLLTNITRNTLDSFYEAGVFIQQCKSMVVSDNKIIARNFTNTTTAINLFKIEDLIISKNEIISFAPNNAIILEDCNGTSTNPIKIYNNFIIHNGTDGDGLYITLGRYFEIYHNSILNNNNQNNSSALQLYYVRDVLLKNNQLIHYGNGYSYNIAPTGTTYLASSDYNNLFSKGTRLAFYGANRATLSALQTATSMESNSLNRDPLFSSTTDLHIIDTFFKNTGTPISYITTDFDGERRNATKPDIGADEIFPRSANDAGVMQFSMPNAPQYICQNTGYPMIVRIKNYGKNTISTVSIRYTVNGAVRGTFIYNDSLPLAKDTMLNIGNLNFTSLGANAVRVYTYLPNGVVDTNNINDTSLILNFVVNRAPLARVGSPQTICGFNTFQIGAASTLGNTYSWVSRPAGFTSNISNPQVSPTVSTYYILTEQVGSCIQKDSVLISVFPIPTANAGRDTAICQGKTAPIGTSSQSGISYQWRSNPTGFASTTAINNVSPLVTSRYFLEVTDNVSKCKNFDTVIVTVNSVPNPFLGLDTAICLGDTVGLSTSPMQGNTYSWRSIPASGTFVGTKYNVNPNINTRYIVTETVNATGCNATDTILITVLSLPNAFAGFDDSLCIGQSIALGNSPQNGLSYQWQSLPTGFSSTVANPNVQPNTTTQYILQVTQNNTGCKNYDTAYIVVSSLPIANAGADKIICQNATTTIGSTAVKGWNYSWSSNPQGFSSINSRPTIQPNQNTTYFLQVTDAKTRCANSDTVEVTVNLLPTPNLGNDIKLCTNDTLQIRYSGISGNTYQWRSLPTGVTQNGLSLFFIPKNNMDLILIERNSATGCQNSDTVKVSLLPLPNAGFSYTPKSACTYTFEADNKNLKSYSWLISSGDTSSLDSFEVVFTQNGKYTAELTVMDTLGCRSTSNTQISLLCTSLEDNKLTEAETIRVYPNPSQNGVINIANLSPQATLRIVDGTGKELKVNEMDIPNETRQIQLPIGIYFISAWDKGVYQSFKVIVTGY